MQAIERLAARLDVLPSSLIRGWILSGLNAHKDETVQSTIERISADVQRLRELVGGRGRAGHDRHSDRRWRACRRRAAPHG